MIHKSLKNLLHYLGCKELQKVRTADELWIKNQKTKIRKVVDQTLDTKNLLALIGNQLSIKDQVQETMTKKIRKAVVSPRINLHNLYIQNPAHKK